MEISLISISSCGFENIRLRWRIQGHHGPLVYEEKSLTLTNQPMIIYCRQRYRYWLKFWTHIALILLVVFTVASYFGDKVSEYVFLSCYMYLNSLQETKKSKTFLTVQQLRTDKLVIAADNFWKHCCKRKYCSIWAIFPFTTLFWTLNYANTCTSFVKTMFDDFYVLKSWLLLKISEWNVQQTALQFQGGKTLEAICN